MMAGGFSDDIIDFVPPEDMTDALLLKRSMAGDREADLELARRSRRRVLGPEVEDSSPLAQRPDDVLLKQIAAGDKEAGEEFYRRYGG